MWKLISGIKPKVAIWLLCAVMLITTGATFAYWKIGIEGNREGSGLSIDIGRGKTVETVVDLSSVAMPGQRLVPLTRQTRANETNYITFKIDVIWTSRDELQGADADYFAGMEGRLTVSLEAVLLNKPDAGIVNEDIKSEKVVGAPDNLIVVEIDYNTAIFGSTAAQPQPPVTVTVAVSMNEPGSAEQYAKINNGQLSLALKFAVQTPDD